MECTAEDTVRMKEWKIVVGEKRREGWKKHNNNRSHVVLEEDKLRKRLLTEQDVWKKN